MIMQICSIRDRQIDAFGRPIFVPHVGAAIRSFGDEINREDPNNEYYKHPGDYDLYHLGHFDDANATFTLLDKPKQLAIGEQLKIRG